MIWNRPVVGLALLLLGVTPAHAGSPLLIREADGLFLPPPADTPVYVYEVTWPQGISWNPWKSGEQAADDLRQTVRPEPFTVESLDERAHKLLVRTSPDGRDLMRRFGAQVAGPEVDSLRKACTEVFVSFAVGRSAPPLEGADFHPDRPCPSGREIDPERTLIIEGLDRRGHRLFVAASDDPRWAIYETVDAAGRFQLLRRGREASEDTYVTFAVPPFGDRLHSLKIWQFDAVGKGAVIARVKLAKERKR